MVEDYRVHTLEKMQKYEGRDFTKFQKWSDRHAHPLSTLREIVKRKVIQGRRTIVVGCYHARRVVGGYTDEMGYFMTPPNEDHSHRDCIAVVDEAPKLTEEDKAPEQTKEVDLIRFFPLGKGANDLPEGYFEEIYMERAGYQRSVLMMTPGLRGSQALALAKKGLNLIYRLLTPGGKLVYDFDSGVSMRREGGGELPSPNQDPYLKGVRLSYSLWKALKDYFWYLVYKGKCQLALKLGWIKPFLIELEDVHRNEDQGCYELRIDPLQKDTFRIWGQIAKYMGLSWNRFDSRFLLPENQGVLDEIAKLHFQYIETPLLKEAGFSEVQFELNVTHWRNQRQHSKLVTAIKG